MQSNYLHAGILLRNISIALCYSCERGSNPAINWLGEQLLPTKSKRPCHRRIIHDIMLCGIEKSKILTSQLVRPRRVGGHSGQVRSSIQNACSNIAVEGGGGLRGYDVMTDTSC